MTAANENMDLPTYQGVVDASKILESVAHRTPLQTSSTLDNELGVKAFVKCENMQRIGAFKFRGAYNAVSHYKDTATGILTYSSGNHAQGEPPVGSKYITLNSWSCGLVFL